MNFENVVVRCDMLSCLLRRNLVGWLRFDNVRISHSELADIFDAAIQSRVTRTLELNDVAVKELSLTGLASLMKRNKSIGYYHLHWCDLGDDGVSAICDALADSTLIKELVLPGNGIGLEGTRAMANFIKKNKSAFLVGLSSNALGDEGVVMLCEGLASNKIVSRLNLSGCNISNAGAVALASLLENSMQLEALYLEENIIESAGIFSLADSLKRNQSLRILNILDNPGLDAEGVENAFIDVFHHNVCLVDLTMEDTTQKISNLLLRNAVLIPAAVRRASLSLIAARRSIEDAGDFDVFPKEIVKKIALEVWATRKDPKWMEALSEAERMGERRSFRFL